jgi:hypothetical protein
LRAAVALFQPVGLDVRVDTGTIAHFNQGNQRRPAMTHRDPLATGIFLDAGMAEKG